MDFELDEKENARFWADLEAFYDKGAPALQDSQQTMPMGPCNAALDLNEVVCHQTHVSLEQRVTYDSLIALVTKELDPTRAIQLSDSYNQFQRKEITPVRFKELMKNIVGDLSLKKAIFELQLDAVKKELASAAQMQSQRQALAQRVHGSSASGSSQTAIYEIPHSLKPTFGNEIEKQLHSLYSRVQENGISRESFVEEINSIVHDELKKRGYT